jgi:hypothetical protein
MLTVPFSADEFFAVFAAYNEFVWPAQILLVSSAAVTLTFRRSGAADRWVAGFLAVLWLWTGSMYHLLHFREINSAAVAFGAMFALQGFLFLRWGVVLNRLSFARAATTRSMLAGAILAYALIIYPVLGGLAGHEYMASPTFGAPCPAVIYAFWRSAAGASGAILASDRSDAMGFDRHFGRDCLRGRAGHRPSGQRGRGNRNAEHRTAPAITCVFFGTRQ